MNEIFLHNTILPVVGSCDYLAASEPFLHPDRITDYHVMIYVTDGCIYVTEDHIDYAIGSGSLFFLKSGLHHFGKTEIKRGTRWYYIHFYMDSPPEAFQLCTASPAPPFHPLTENSITPLSLALPKQLTNLSASPIEAHIISLAEAFHSDDVQHRWNINQQCFQLLTEIAFFDQKSTSPLSLADQIAQFLTAHYEQPFSAAILEQKFFLSYKYMASVFKKEKQLTMQQYHTQVRMNHACKLLRSTLLPIGEISQKVGYSDMLYFSRCFHTYIGMSPTEYRRQPHSY